MAEDRFREDIIIANDDGYLYHISQNDLKHGKNAKGETFRVDPQEFDKKHHRGCYQNSYGDVLRMLSDGLVVGAVPPKPKDSERGDIGLVAAIVCYVLNIDALKHYNKWEPGHEAEDAAGA